MNPALLLQMFGLKEADIKEKIQVVVEAATKINEIHAMLKDIVPILVVPRGTSVSDNDN